MNFSFCSRVGQRGGGLTSSAARSEHEVSEIIDGISEHEVRSSFKNYLPLHLFFAMLRLMVGSTPRKKFCIAIVGTCRYTERYKFI